MIMRERKREREREKISERERMENDLTTVAPLG
jgi:hypothetical protein